MKRFAARFVVMAALALLCGCSDGGVSVGADGTAAVSEAGVKIVIPADWNIFTGDDIYEKAYQRLQDEYKSSSEMKKDLEDNGETYIIYAESPDQSAMALFSSQKMNFEGEAPSPEELARTTHDSAVFELRANGFYTESSFSNEKIGDGDCWLSVIKIFDTDGGTAYAEQREMLFGREAVFYSLKIFADGQTGGPSPAVRIDPI